MMTTSYSQPLAEWIGSKLRCSGEPSLPHRLVISNVANAPPSASTAVCDPVTHPDQKAPVQLPVGKQRDRCATTRQNRTQAAGRREVPKAAELTSVPHVRRIHHPALSDEMPDTTKQRKANSLARSPAPLICINSLGNGNSGGPGVEPSPTSLQALNHTKASWNQGRRPPAYVPTCRYLSDLYRNIHLLLLQNRLENISKHIQQRTADRPPLLIISGLSGHGRNIQVDEFLRFIAVTNEVVVVPNKSCLDQVQSQSGYLDERLMKPLDRFPGINVVIYSCGIFKINMWHVQILWLNRTPAGNRQPENVPVSGLE
ncbi:Uncharacterised protein [Klebsiella variicola]|nr:hypothetical protein L386_02765 [Klebsiella variicola]CAB5641333.1 Uncharacterised protein [Klebsiella variicola]